MKTHLQNIYMNPSWCPPMKESHTVNSLPMRFYGGVHHAAGMESQFHFP